MINLKETTQKKMRLIGGSQPKPPQAQQAMKPIPLRAIHHNNQNSSYDGETRNTVTLSNVNTTLTALPTRREYNRARNASVKSGVTGLPTVASRQAMVPPQPLSAPVKRPSQQNQFLQNSLHPMKRARTETVVSAVATQAADVMGGNPISNVGAEETVYTVQEEEEDAQEEVSEEPFSPSQSQTLEQEEEEQEVQEQEEASGMSTEIMKGKQAANKSLVACATRIMEGNKEIMEILEKSLPSSQNVPRHSAPSTTTSGSCGSNQASTSTTDVNNNNIEGGNEERPHTKERMLMPYMPPTFPVVLLHLGNGRYLTGGYVDGDHVIRIQDCFPRKHNDEKRRNIKLNKLQFLDLVSAFSTITGELNRLKSCQQTCIDEDDKKHIGGNIYVSLFRSIEDNLFVDIRQFFIPDEEFAKGQCKLIPTKSGISLRATEWEELVKVAQHMKVYIPALRKMGRCITTHEYQEHLATCTHCSPNWMLDTFV